MANHPPPSPAHRTSPTGKAEFRARRRRRWLQQGSPCLSARVVLSHRLSSFWRVFAPAPAVIAVNFGRLVLFFCYPPAFPNPGPRPRAGFFALVRGCYTASAVTGERIWKSVVRYQRAQAPWSCGGAWFEQEGVPPAGYSNPFRSVNAGLCKLRAGCPSRVLDSFSVAFLISRILPLAPAGSALL